MNNAEKFKKVWNNPYLFAKNFMKIQDKNDKLVPFNFNELQKDFLNKKSKFNIILKSRQLGFSVMVCAYAIWIAITTPNSHCLMLSYNNQSKNEIFNKLKQIYMSIPDVIRPKLTVDNRDQIGLENGSIIACSVMGAVEKGRGGTNSLIWMSEYSFVKSEDAEKQLNSLEQSLNNNGCLIIESTANGLNFFHNLYQKSKRKENIYKAFFYNYIDGADMFTKQYISAQDSWKEIHGKRFSKEDLNEEELEILKNYPKATLDMMCWRRSKINNSSRDKFNQEYPINDNVAFISSGAGVFDNERVSTVLQSIIINKNTYLKKSEIKDLPSICTNYYGKSFFMYKNVVQGEKYYIGVDTSEGLGKDFSTCVVLNKDAEEVAIFKNNKIKPYQFAEFINELGRYYNKAHLIIERASGGHAVIERLKNDYRYINMYRGTTYDNFNKMIRPLGFSTNGKTKSLIINNLREMFEKGEILIHSAEILEEMKVFEVKDNGSMGAMGGYHDDLVMGLALALEGVLKRIHYIWE
ncbi:UNVERIFIED_ORG: hypothetical protein B2H93_14805 [Clostridium botulinum]